ncbi:MAG: hypothetical protein JWQ48_1004 [Conexibacter sp.]|nr:hypothetical protein [Conexibacter sp.]
MSLIDALDRIGAIQAQIAPLTGAAPAAAAAPAATAPVATAATAPTSFASLLSQAQGVPSNGAPPGTTSPQAVGFASPTGGAVPGPLPGASLLTNGQQQFASRLAAQTGMETGVISAWMLAEESGGAATSRETTNNHDWLNIGYTDSGTYGAQAAIWDNPITAADATAGWLKGQDTIPGYGKAAPGVQAILSSAGQPPATQIAALQHSGWASSGYPDVPQLYQQVAGGSLAASASLAQRS